MDSNKQPLPVSNTSPDTPIETNTATSAPPPPIPTPPNQSEYEATPEFQNWKQEQLSEAQAYLKNAWGMEMPIEKLVLWRDDAGFPDPVRWAGAHKQILANRKFRDKNGNTLGNYNIWRSLD
ncbi:hypothetical protein QUA82_09940 [Microcoleus sp. F8-D3]